ncbi:unnamed protein product [Caenorhabditis bovis]|uniref:Serpentine receptor class gamma n=1 Tax=Caenorhabditis bovis TaxID=2654633 RepID=A0A8S1FEQ6_9PELO|nr:unnamed protein product [Caenorhabditis bovis]
MSTNLNIENTTIQCHPPSDQLFSLVAIYIVQGVYGFLSIAVYCLNIRALYRQRNYHDKTFRLLYTYCAAFSITYFLDHYLIRRFVKLGFFCEEILYLFSEPNYILNPYKKLASYCPLAILVFHTFIAVHRFSIVFRPTKALQLYEMNLLNGIVIIGVSIPLIFMWFMVPTRSYAKLDKESDGGLDIEYKKVFNISSSLFACIAAVIFGMITLICTILMILYLLKSNVRKLRLNEIRMIIFEIFMAIFTFIYAFVQGFLYYSIHMVKDLALKAVIIQFRTFAIDIFILPQAWTLLILSPMIRSYTFKFMSNKSSSLHHPSNIENSHSGKSTISRPTTVV